MSNKLQFQFFRRTFIGRSTTKVIESMNSAYKSITHDEISIAFLKEIKGDIYSFSAPYSGQ